MGTIRHTESTAVGSTPLKWLTSFRDQTVNIRSLSMPSPVALGAQLASAQTASKLTAVLMRSSSSWHQGAVGWKHDIHVHTIERETVQESHPQRSAHGVPRVRPGRRESRSHEDTP